MRRTHPTAKGGLRMTKLGLKTIPSYVAGAWQSGQGNEIELKDAVTSEAIFLVSSQGIDVAESIHYARTKNAELRKLSFHDRAIRLRAIAKHLMERKEAFYELSYHSGTTRKDAWIDIEGGISTLFSYSSLVRREFANESFLLEDATIPLSKDNTFSARHILTPKEGVAVHINAFNFPCWGMLEKFAPTFLAGVPSIIKPAPQTAYLAEAMVREMVASGFLPEGSLQLISGDIVDFLPHLAEQDVVTFTGSARTGKMLKKHDNVIDKSIPFTLEADSLNCAILGASVEPDKAEFELFIKEVAREITVKAGQKCTAVRRVIVPKHLVDAVGEALKKRLATTTIGDPKQDDVRMGPLVDKTQQSDVQSKIEALKASSEVMFQASFDSELENGAFVEPTLLYCDTPLSSSEPHTLEAFGPVATLMPFESLEEAAEIARLGRGSLVSSIVSQDNDEVCTLAMALAPQNGRLHILNRHNAKSSTGHGSPLPQLTHGGPGRAGGGEELGGARAIKHYMQRTAIQADPSTLMAVTKEYVSGAVTTVDRAHPFTKTFDELQIGETLLTHRRTVTEADIVNFANVSGDFFYAHVDEIAATESIFEKRVAHGYFLVSAAAGLFVHPAKGPVLANYGLENLRFIEPVGIGDTIRAQLTVKQKIKKEKREADKVATGVVEWDVKIRNQDEAVVAVYSILTLVERAEDSDK